MGKTKIKTIDDSQPEEIKKEPRKKILAINKDLDKKRAKSEPDKAAGEVEHTTEGEVSEESGAKQTRSERSGDASGALRPDERAKIPPKQGKKRSKKYLAALEKVDKSKNYPIPDAVELIKNISYTKFPGTLEIHINTNVKSLRGLVSLPYVSGKKLTILAFGPPAFLRAEKIEGVRWADEEDLKELEKGKINFDVLITTPEWMPRLARLAKVLGPKGLMPNPKNNTITSDLKKAVTEVQTGKVEYKTEKVSPVIHLSLGKLSQPDEELTANIKVLLSSIGKAKIKKAVISPTMGPGIKLDTSSV